MLIDVVILAAGQGSRMLSSNQKALQPVAGVAMLRHVIDLAVAVNPSTINLVIRQGKADLFQPYVNSNNDIRLCEQQVAHGEGTGAGFKAALEHIADSDNRVILVLYADTPLLELESAKKLIAQIKDDKKALAIAGFKVASGDKNYGKIITDKAGSVIEIREKSKDLTGAFANSGVMAINAKVAHDFMDKIAVNKKSKEIYLTDFVALCYQQKLSTSMVAIPASEAIGVDSKDRLAKAEAIWQERRRQKALCEEGVILISPESVYFSYYTKLEKDIIIEPNVFFAGKVEVKEGSHIKAFSHIEGATIDKNTIIGPFARLREGSNIGQKAKIGSFVEVKNSKLADGVKVPHLSYVGDANIGEKSNIGAGVIFCNYDGKNKHKTIIGRDVFVGSLSALIAPINIDDESYIAAGSVVNKSLPKKSFAISRAELKIKDAIKKDD